MLGQLTINGQPGALLPAQTQLIVALAVNGPAGLSNAQLCDLLGADADHPKPADSLRQLIARTRRQLGQADDGKEWIIHLGHGKYALHPDSRVDWREFQALTDEGTSAKDAGKLAAALSMIRGPAVYRVLLLVARHRAGRFGQREDRRGRDRTGRTRPGQARSGGRGPRRADRPGRRRDRGRAVAAADARRARGRKSGRSARRVVTLRRRSRRGRGRRSAAASHLRALSFSDRTNP